MLEPKIISLGVAVPEYTYTQAEVFQQLAYPRHFWRIFRDAQIETRHFAVPLDQIRGLTFQEQQEHYQKNAVILAEKALTDALDGRSPSTLGLLAYSTCTGFPPGPVVPDFLARDLGLAEDVEIANLSSQGCEAAFPGLKRCLDFTTVHKRPSAAIACEITSCTYFPEKDGEPASENAYELARANAIFADGCSCAIVGYDDGPRHPTIVDTVSHLDTRYIDRLGYVWRDGRLRVKLSRDVPEIAVSLLAVSLGKLLSRNGLRFSDVRYWVIHPPGAAVLDRLRDTLGIGEEKLKYSRQVLRQFANCSSATVGIVGKTLIDEEKDPEGYLVMANVGPGMVSNAMLCRFG